jgi:hypothetical protein
MNTFAPTFTKTITEMTKKFTVLAVMAAMFVACGGNSAAEMEAKAKATADSLIAVHTRDSIASATTAAAAAAAALDSTAKAAMDTMATKVEGAIDAVKTAVGH